MNGPDADATPVSEKVFVDGFQTSTYWFGVLETVKLNESAAGPPMFTLRTTRSPFHANAAGAPASSANSSAIITVSPAMRRLTTSLPLNVHRSVPRKMVLM